MEGLQALGQPQPGKLPTRVGRKEIAVACADMIARGGARAAAQHILVDHELAVVLAHCSLPSLVARVALVAAAGPLPYVAQCLH
jgi:hypothetical protein